LRRESKKISFSNRAGESLAAVTAVDDTAERLSTMRFHVIVAVVMIATLPACALFNEPSELRGEPCPPPEEGTCVTSDDCPKSANPCEVATCDDARCVSLPAPHGTSIPDTKPGDCARDVCSDPPGHISSQPDPSDLPVVGECMIGTCATGADPSAKPDGSVCSIGLCKAGACVEQITVICAASEETIYGCGPEQSPEQAVMWTGSDGKAHACMGNALGQAEYCAPGTPCYGFLFGVQHKGTCIDSP
jgi:hypothetical protein